MTITKARPDRAHPPAPLFAGQSSEADQRCTDDFVDDLLAIVCRRLPGLSVELAAEVAAEVRGLWGGSRPYIARRAGEGRSARNEAIRRDYHRGERLPLLERRYKLSQGQLSRIIRGL